MTAALKSRADRYEHGRELRARTPREAHAELHGPRDRDAVAILAESDPERVAELLPRRYKLMTADAFGFLRGAAAVMAADLAHQPIAGAPVQACGDCHLMNFGAFNSPEDNILFDINDFDETLPGVDFTVDLKRLAASVAVAARAANMSDKRARSLAAGAVTAYREHMFALMDLSPLEIWHSRIDLEQQLKHIESPELRRSLSTLIRHAQHRGLDKDDNFPHLVTGGEPRIADKPPTIFHISPKTVGGRKIDFERGFALYRETLTPDRTVLLDRYRLMDVAFKAVGVGSVGTICVVGLFLSGDDEPLFLQVKQAQRSVLERLSDEACLSRPAGQARGRRAADDAGGKRHLPRVDFGRAFEARILCSRSEEPPPRRGERSRRAGGAVGICSSVRPDARPFPRPHRRPGGHRRLHGKERRVRRRACVRSPWPMPIRRSRITPRW